MPPHCPHSDCSASDPTNPFPFRHFGRYRRKCDGHHIRRFLCRTCGRTFSKQTFKTNYRHRIPYLNYPLARLLASKVTRRQAARILGVNRKTVERRYHRLARVAEEYHWGCLDSKLTDGGLRGIFQLDELETFETDRRLKPVTVAVQIERKSYFMISAYAGTLAARGGLTESYRKKKSVLEAVHGKRRSQSRMVVRASFETLRKYGCSAKLQMETDRKGIYPQELTRVFGESGFVQRTTHSKARRDYRNPLFPINHTLAMMRDGLSCLVRRSWGAAKEIRGLQAHCWIWVAWRNYVRGITVKTRTTPAMAMGVQSQPQDWVDVFRWRWPRSMSLGATPKGARFRGHDE